MRLLFLLASLLPLISNAQTGRLTVFNDNGISFLLYVNEVQQNKLPQNVVKVDGIRTLFCDVRIVFNDSSLAPLVKKNIAVSDGNDILMDVSYKIKQEKNGKTKLQFYSMFPVEKPGIGSKTAAALTAENPAIHKQQEAPKPANTRITNDTTEKMPVSVTKPAEIPAIKPGQAVLKKCNGWPIVREDFEKLKKTVYSIQSENERLKTAKKLTAENCLLVSQVMDLGMILKEDKFRLDYLLFAYSYTIDRQNYNRVKELLKNPEHQKAISDIQLQR